MNPLNVIRGFDPDLYTYFETELERQHLSLSFIPDENSISPLCAAIMGSVLVNTTKASLNFSRMSGVEGLASKRICSLFKADHANIRTITIEAASRVVFQALTRRGDVVMSLDLRKKEHCNSESFAYRFVNFGVDPNTEKLDMDAIEKQAMECRPQLIICSPINYPLAIDYERFSKIAKACGAVLWCDISQTAGLIAGGVLPSPVPYADVVTFTAHGAMQGPQSSIILCTQDLANAIDRVVVSSGHVGLHTSHLAALAARVEEMKDPVYAEYSKRVVDNAKALAEGLKEGGLKLVSGGTETHQVIVDAKSCALSARGAQELLAESGVMVRICNVLTQDQAIKYEGIRFSTLSPSTRGATPSQMKEIGLNIADFLTHPYEANGKILRDQISRITVGLPDFYDHWMPKQVRENLVKLSVMSSDSAMIKDSIHPSRLELLARKYTEKHSKK